MHELKLETNTSPFFALSWTVVHVIDEFSPLFGLEKQQLLEEKIRIHITFVGIDDVYAQTVHCWHAYTADQVVFAKRFIDMITFQPNDSVTIDYTKIHQYE